ncbi:uncharacterized protein [Solanum lycopersicum]|uniref:uncharacterized protein n=1 Tax=Solanum lycopersicum TaxID=4081 RepID=UPI0037483E48
MTDSDIILGMAWLSPYHDVLNYNTKSLTLKILGRERFELEGVYKPKKVKVISFIWDNTLVEQRLLAYLAHVRDVKSEASSIWSILVVSEFSEVFFNDFPGLPPDRDIDFCIDLDPGTRPISTPSYRMDLAKLRELKAQTQEFFYKGFINPCSSPWRDPILFVKKNDGSMRMYID